MSKLLPILFLVFCLFSPEVVFGETKVADVARELSCDCPDCGKQSVDQCLTKCETGRKHGAAIAAQLKQGRSKEQILNWFADTYGEHLLGNPRPRGLGKLAPLVPYLALLVGLIPLTLVLRSRRRPKTKVGVASPGQTSPQPAGQEAPDDARLTAALRDFDY